MAKHSIIIDGHKTSVSLEDTFWNVLKEIAQGKGVPVSGLVAEIEKGRQNNNLSSAIRIFVLEQVRGGSF
jgi:predicted DNA-binding ribbon-helix-helix protein